MKKILSLSLFFCFAYTYAQEPGTTDPQVSIERDTDAYVPNEFIGSFDMVIHSFKKGNEDKDSPMTMRFWSKEDMIMVQPMVNSKDAQDMKMLTDLKNKYQYTLMTDNKGKRTAMKMPKQKINVKNADKSNEKQDPDNMNVQRTNETRTIEGHLCHKYIGSNEEGTWEAWVAEGVKAPFEELGRTLAGGMGGGKKQKAPKNHTDGLPMESTYESKDGKEKTVMHIKQLKLGSVDESAFDISGYEVMELPAMPGMMFGRRSVIAPVESRQHP